MGAMALWTDHSAAIVEGMGRERKGGGVRERYVRFARLHAPSGRPARSFLLPAGEGGRYGRMRVIGPHESHVLGRKVDRGSQAPHPPLRGTFSRGEKGEDVEVAGRTSACRPFTAAARP